LLQEHLPVRLCASLFASLLASLLTPLLASFLTPLLASPCDERFACGHDLLLLFFTYHQQEPFDQHLRVGRLAAAVEADGLLWEVEVGEA
jgi:hypothetical protein